MPHVTLLVDIERHLPESGTWTWSLEDVRDHTEEESQGKDDPQDAVTMSGFAPGQRIALEKAAVHVLQVFWEVDSHLKLRLRMRRNDGSESIVENTAPRDIHVTSSTGMVYLAWETPCKVTGCAASDVCKRPKNMTFFVMCTDAENNKVQVTGSSKDLANWNGQMCPSSYKFAECWWTGPLFLSEKIEFKLLQSDTSGGSELDWELPGEKNRQLPGPSLPESVRLVQANWGDRLCNSLEFPVPWQMVSASTQTMSAKASKEIATTRFPPVGHRLQLTLEALLMILLEKCLRYKNRILSVLTGGTR